VLVFVPVLVNHADDENDYDHDYDQDRDRNDDHDDEDDDENDCFPLCCSGLRHQCSARDENIDSFPIRGAMTTRGNV